MDRKGSNSDLKNADRMRGGKSFGFSIHAFAESFAEYPLRQCLIGSASSVRQSSEELAGTYIFVNASPRRYGWRQCGGVYQLAPGAGRGIFDEPQITVSINYVADLEATRHREANMSTQAIDPLPGDVASLADLTEYQEGAIVSRTIVQARARICHALRFRRRSEAQRTHHAVRRSCPGRRRHGGDRGRRGLSSSLDGRIDPASGKRAARPVSRCAIQDDTDHDRLKRRLVRQRVRLQPSAVAPPRRA